MYEMSLCLGTIGDKMNPTITNLVDFFQKLIFLPPSFLLFVGSCQETASGCQAQCYIELKFQEVMQ